MKTIDELLSQVAKEMNVDSPEPNNPVQKLTLSLAKEIAFAVEKGAEQMGLTAVIAICNDGANPILLHAMDDSYIASVKVAEDKAYTSMALKMPTHIALEESRGGAFDGLTNGNGILLLGGGYPLEYNGKIFGSVGVSGGTKDEDIKLAKLGADYFKTRMNR